MAPTDTLVHVTSIETKHKKHHRQESARRKQNQRRVPSRPPVPPRVALRVRSLHPHIELHARSDDGDERSVKRSDDPDGHSGSLGLKR
jgi:hypothetical protein